MNHVYYLVVANYGFDDIPVKLFIDDRDGALNFIDELEEAPDSVLKALDLEMHDNNPACISIVEFVDGNPVKREVIKELD